MTLTVTPGFINVVVPSTGTIGKETFIINNGSSEKQCFKLKGTKLDRFDVDPSFGFIEKKGKLSIKVQPKKFGNEGLAKNDHFTILVAPAPDGLKDPKDMWARGNPKEPKNPKRFVVQIVYVKDEAGKGDNLQTEACEKKDSADEEASDTSEESQGGSSKKKAGGSGKKDKKKAASAKPSVFMDDEKTLPPEDLEEVPIFQEYHFRKYD